MAKRETLKEFVKNIQHWDANMIARFTKAISRASLLGLGESQDYAPMDIGTLILSGGVLKTRKTAKGYTSGFQFTVPYAKPLEKGERNGKKLNISREVNKKAQSGYGSKGLRFAEAELIEMTGDIVGKTFDKL